MTKRITEEHLDGAEIVATPMTERITDDELQQYYNYPNTAVVKLALDLRDARARVRELELDMPAVVRARNDWNLKYNALREVGNKLADYLLRALPDMESFGSKTDLEREKIARWKELVEGGDVSGECGCSRKWALSEIPFGKHICKPEGGGESAAKSQDDVGAESPALDCSPVCLDCLGMGYFYDEENHKKDDCGTCDGTGEEPKE